jgi:glycerate kinase
VLIAPQEYKGTLTAAAAARAIGDGLLASRADLELDLLPLADGGPGTVDALIAAVGGERIATAAHNPLLRPLVAEWGLLATGVAVIECAAASGLLRLRPHELDPRAASTLGTGELVVAALDRGCRDILIGLGGSATNDGGAGLAVALGYRLLDANGAALPPGGAALARLDRIDAAKARPEIGQARFLGATDVTNLLCGPEGASAVYGPQKGADAAAIAELDAALAHFAVVIERDLGTAVAALPRAGAAGGLGAGLVAFLGAELRSGAEVVAAAAGLADHIAAADLVVTGEGRLDGQTAFGKTPYQVARLAAAAGKPVLCLPGALASGWESSAGLFQLIEAASRDGGVPPTPALAAADLGTAAGRALSALGLAGR